MKDWLRSFTIFRQADGLLCHVWADGGSKCEHNVGRVIEVRRQRGGSHPSVADYIAAAEKHLQEAHPERSVPEERLSKLTDLVNTYRLRATEALGQVENHLDANPINTVGASLAQAEAETYERVAEELEALL